MLVKNWAIANVGLMNCDQKLEWLRINISWASMNQSTGPLVLGVLDHNRVTEVALSIEIIECISTYHLPTIYLPSTYHLPTIHLPSTYDLPTI